ncbi:SDR family oxidoreductase [Gangjinia marincola]|uniref:SDR family oxidoreductase n=1 Tax=Gangjinia marincola TaxID=578463 RepID=A0ABP3Y018_9FLAO
MSKYIIITGTSRGIGFELAKYFAIKGHTVLALSRNSTAIKSLNHTNIIAIDFDLSLAEDYKKVKNVVSDWPRVDILINNAGSLLNKPFAETSMVKFKQVYEVNVFGVAQLIQTVLPFMSKGGHVVTISSMGGIQGSMKFPGLAAYSSSKGAVITLTELLAEEYKETGPSFNVIALGAVQTEMLEEAFPGYEAPVSAQEMADYIGHFALTGNKFYNGKVLQASSTTP